MKSYLAFLLLAVVAACSAQKTVTALPNAHAHNDYEHQRPLFDAIRYGFTSIEADIHLIGGEIYVAHDTPQDLENTPTLGALYLDPLRRWIEQHKGRVYASYEEPILLMIDIKTKGLPTYEALKPILREYEEILWHVEDGKVKWGPVRVFLSGNRPIAQVQADQIQWVSIDGRPTDIGQDYSANFMPVISDNYRRHLSWRGRKADSKPGGMGKAKDLD